MDRRLKAPSNIVVKIHEVSPGNAVRTVTFSTDNHHNEALASGIKGLFTQVQQYCEADDLQGEIEVEIT